MKNTFGDNITLTVFGESHGSAIGVVIDGLAPGISIDEEKIAYKLLLRRPSGGISTSRVEADKFKIESGVYEGKTTGTPVTIIIPNENTKSGDYKATENLARPAHADYTAYMKYHGFEDRRGGGHFSGRITAGIVAAGAIFISALENKGIYIGTHMKKCAGVSDRDFSDLTEDVKKLINMRFPVLSGEAGSLMQEKIMQAREEKDSVGGILETAIIGVPAGLGEPYFDSIESKIAHAMFSIGGVKGIEFGKGFALSDMVGSKANDAFRMENGKVITETNNNGGINGGITNGMPILFSLAVKPTPSIFRVQKTVDFVKGEDAEIELKGRHDPCIVHRAKSVADALSAFVIADVLTGRYGTDYLAD
ncbi:MAG: chorismate synthase [Clostridia bacterium]|nr:chorismate synthase [Clostridia bacterium]